MKRIAAILAILGFILPMIANSCAEAGVRRYKVRVVKEYPHDVTSYTQGLFFDGGKLYESTGQYGSSTFRQVDLQTGKAVRKLDFDRKYFVEGSVILDGELFILTWESRVAFVYDASTLEYKQTRRYPREGWGLTTDGKSLVASDGSSSIYFMDKDFKVEKTLKVRMNGRPLSNLNELEFIDGKIWANVYLTDMIVIINPSSGVVEASIDCTGLLPRHLRTRETDVLNGIARDSATGKIYLTGKNWKRLYEIELTEKK
ncbi:MAG: glutaminyl-peptide cyclotransferase [Bacteroidales bacterium]|nr:glutaminyl-peptide cyclotransferase [Bacteroidales bacterium]MBQ5943709.1 glutaminyl-peptide cyclotransferase [Bacteroidales bacterium]